MAMAMAMAWAFGAALAHGPANDAPSAVIGGQERAAVAAMAAAARKAQRNLPKTAKGVLLA